MIEAAPYLAALANAAVLGAIGLMLRSLGRSAGASAVADQLIEPEYRVAALQQPSVNEAIVLRLDELDACDLRDRPASVTPVPVAPAPAAVATRRHHHH